MDEDETTEEFAAAQSEEPTVRESREVVTQRIQDLCRYLKSTLPGLFGKEDKVPLKGSDLLTVLRELDEEFSYSYSHRAVLINLIAARVAAVVEPMVDAVPASELTRNDLTEEELEEIMGEDGAIHGTVEVLWDSILPGLPGDLGQLADLASVPVTCVLNSFLWDTVAWITVADNLLDTLEPMMDLLMGMVGFQLLITYIRVIEAKEVPTMTYHMEA